MLTETIEWGGMMAIQRGPFYQSSFAHLTSPQTDDYKAEMVKNTFCPYSISDSVTLTLLNDVDAGTVDWPFGNLISSCYAQYHVVAF